MIACEKKKTKVKKKKINKKLNLNFITYIEDLKKKKKNDIHIMFELAYSNPFLSS